MAQPPFAFSLILRVSVSFAENSASLRGSAGSLSAAAAEERVRPAGRVPSHCRCRTSQHRSHIGATLLFYKAAVSIPFFQARFLILLTTIHQMMEWLRMMRLGTAASQMASRA